MGRGGTEKVGTGLPAEWWRGGGGGKRKTNSQGYHYFFPLPCPSEGQKQRKTHKQTSWEPLHRAFFFSCCFFAPGQVSLHRPYPDLKENLRER